MTEAIKKGEAVLMCSLHKKQEIIRFCTSEKCEQPCALCKSCLADHDHQNMMSISYERLKYVATSRQERNNPLSREKVTSLLRNFRTFATDLRQAVDRMLQEVTAIGDEILRRYIELPRPKSFEDYLKMTGQQLREIYIPYKNNLDNNEAQLHPKLVAQLQQYKALMSPLIFQLKEAVQISTLFSLYPIPSQEYRFTPKDLDSIADRFDSLLGFDSYEDKSKVQSNQIAKDLRKLNIEKKYEKVLEQAQGFIDKYPRLAVAYYEKGFAQFELGLYNRSFVSYSISAELKGAPHMSNTHRGMCLIHLGLIQQGISSCDDALKLKPQYANAFFHKGIAYEKMHRYQQAMACYQKSSRLNPSLEFVDKHISQLKGKMDEIDNKSRAVPSSQIEGTNQSTSS